MQLLFLKFSRSDEYQADALGIRYARQARYSPGEMLRFFTALENMSGERDQPQDPHLPFHPSHDQGPHRQGEGHGQQPGRPPGGQEGAVPAPGRRHDLRRKSPPGLRREQGLLPPGDGFPVRDPRRLGRGEHPQAGRGRRKGRQSGPAPAGRDHRPGPGRVPAGQGQGSVRPGQAAESGKRPGQPSPVPARLFPGAPGTRRAPGGPPGLHTQGQDGLYVHRPEHLRRRRACTNRSWSGPSSRSEG